MTRRKTNQAQQTDEAYSRILLEAHDRFVLGGHVIERGDLLDYDPTDGSTVLSVTMRVGALALRDLLDGGAARPAIQDQDASHVRARLSHAINARDLDTRAPKVIPIGPRLESVR